MVALVNNAIGLSCLLPSGSGSNTADKNTGASYIHINRLVSTCAVYTQGNTSATGKLCGCGCLLLQINFVYGAFEMGFHVISRFRDDAYFRYLITEEPTGKRGRPKLYDGKIEMEHLEEDRFEIVNLENGQGRILSAVVHSRSLNRNIRLCIHFLFFKCPVVNSISMG